jgi:hypothetical protein
MPFKHEVAYADASHGDWNDAKSTEGAAVRPVLAYQAHTITLRLTMVP